MAHARKSPSKAKLLHACAGALILISKMPAEHRAVAGQEARIGSAAHHLLEVCLGKGDEPQQYLGRLIRHTKDRNGDVRSSKILGVSARMEQGDHEVDQDMVDGVTMCYEYVLRRCDEAGVQRTDLILEGKTNPLPDRDDTSGTADVAIDAWPTLEVVDYKNGRMMVEHEDNEQLLSYLLGRAHDTGWKHWEYIITVVQPNAGHAEGCIRSQTVTPQELRDFETLHRAVCDSADTAEEDYYTTEFDGWAKRWLQAGPWCDSTLCEARAVCPVLKAWKQAQAGVEFDADPEPLPNIDAVDEAVKVLRWAPHLQAQIRLAKAIADAHVKAGKSHPDLKVVRARGRGAWRDDLTPHQIAKVMVEKGFISHNEQARLWNEPTLVTGPQAEKLITGKGSGGKRKEFRQELMTTKQGSLQVVLADEPGESVTVDPNEDFKGVDNEDI